MLQMIRCCWYYPLYTVFFGWARVVCLDLLCEYISDSDDQLFGQYR